MAKYEGSVPYTGFIAPADDTDTFNVTDERFNKGGYRSVINQIERLAITPERRKEGMLVKQLDTGGYWTLEGGITNNDWVEPEFAASVIADRLYQPDGTNAFVYTDNSGNLHIDGNIIQNGASYETHAEKLYTTRDFIITRENAVSALAVGALSGIQVTKYDGLNDLIFGTDKDGFFKIGESSNLQTVGTRQDSPIAKGLGYYNEALYRWDTTAHMKFNTTSNNLEVSGIKLGTLNGLLNATAGVIGTTTLKTINSQSVIGSGNIVVNGEDLRWDGGSTGLNAATGRASLGLTDAVLGTGSAGKVAWWKSATELDWTSKLTYDFTNSLLEHQGHTTLKGSYSLPVTEGSGINGSLRIGGVGTGVAMDIGVTATPGAYGPWFQGRNTGDYSNHYSIYLNPNGGGVAIGKTAVTSGYRLDVNGATAMTGLKVGTISGTTRMNGGVMEAASITISTSEPSTSGRLNGDIWVRL